MKKKVIILLFVLSFSLWEGCISFKVRSLTPPENQLESFCLCKKIEDKGDLLNPIDIQSEFSSKDTRIICFIRLKNVSEEIKLMWKWYSPEKKLIKKLDAITVNQEREYLEAVTAYDELKIETEKLIAGQWIVAFFINGKLAGRKIFQVNP